jgi:hypothetical protein
MLTPEQFVKFARTMMSTPEFCTVWMKAGLADALADSTEADFEGLSRVSPPGNRRKSLLDY